MTSWSPPMAPVERGGPDWCARAGWWASLFVVLLAVLAVLVFFIGRNAGGGAP